MTLVNDKNFHALQYFTADNIHSPEIAAVFATRNGGVSGKAPGTEHLHSMNLQFNSECENHENVAENYRIIASSQGFRMENIFSLHQVHSDKIITVTEKNLSDNPFQFIAEADALITNIKGMLLSVRTADCVPILLHDSKNNAIGAVHAGWRGTFLQIGAKTVRHMAKQFGSNATDIYAAIGPAIGMCCYEVSNDFYSQFHIKYGDEINKFFTVNHGSKPYCNLSAMNKMFLINAGVPEKNIELSELCTMCNPELFFSHRKSGKKRGTMAAFIGMK